MSISRKDLEDLVEKGLVADIFRMEQAFELLKRIGERSKDFNNSEHGNLSELFAVF